MLPPDLVSSIQNICNNRDVISNYRAKIDLIIRKKIDKLYRSHSSLYKKRNLIVNDTIVRTNAAIAELIGYASAWIDHSDMGCYDVMYIKKKNGKSRKILNPRPVFKKFLRKINKLLQIILFTRRSSNELYIKDVHALNGKRTEEVLLIPFYKKSTEFILNTLVKSFAVKYIAKTDIRDAFGSTKLNAVLSAFLLSQSKLGYSYDISQFLFPFLRACFVNGVLPQGYPTSPVIFNFFFDYIKERSSVGSSVINYLDDIFIIPRDNYGVQDKYETQYALNNVLRTLRHNGLHCNLDKTNVYPIGWKKNPDGSYSSHIRKKFLGRKIQCTAVRAEEPKTHSFLLEDKKYDIVKYKLTGTREEKNKQRMLRYILAKEKEFKLSQQDSKYDSADKLQLKLNNFNQYYFNSNQRDSRGYRKSL